MRLGHAIHQFDAGLPAEVFLDLRVVTIAPIDSFGRIQLVLAFEFQAGNLLDDIDQPAWFWTRRPRVT